MASFVPRQIGADPSKRVEAQRRAAIAAAQALGTANITEDFKAKERALRRQAQFAYVQQQQQQQHHVPPQQPTSFQPAPQQTHAPSYGNYPQQPPPRPQQSAYTSNHIPSQARTTTQPSRTTAPPTNTPTPPIISRAPSTQVPAQTSTEETNTKKQKKKKMKPNRQAGGDKWYDPVLAEWDPNDFRIFCGDLGNEVNEDILSRAFTKYPSFQRARVVRDRATKKSKGFGFVSFKDGKDWLRALKEMNGISPSQLKKWNSK
eukprot:gene4265-6589_t